MMANHSNSSEGICKWAGTHALDALTAEERAAYQEHLQRGCPICGSDFLSFEEVAGQLGLAGKAVEPPASLRERLLRRIAEAPAPAEAPVSVNSRAAAMRPRFNGSWVPRLSVAMAVSVVCLGAWAALWVWNEPQELDHAAQEAYIDSLYARVMAIVRLGLGDHVHCTVFRKFPKDPPTFEEMAEKMGPEHVGLVPLVREIVPSEYRIFLAHRCGYRGRKFIHLALKSELRLISVVITRTRPGESFSKEGLLPVLHEAGVPIYQAAVDHFEIAGFESENHLGFVVSDLTQEQNLELAAHLAPAVHRFLSHLKG